MLEAFPLQSTVSSETSVSLISHGSIARTRKDENKPPTFLFLSIHLSKSAKPTPSQAQLPTEDAPTARLPGPSSPPSAINPLPGQRPKSPSLPRRSGPRRLEPANRPVNRPEPTPKRQEAPTPRTMKDSDRPIQSPGSAPLHHIVRRPRSACPPSGGPRRPVGEAASTDHLRRRQQADLKKSRISPRRDEGRATVASGMGRVLRPYRLNLDMLAPEIGSPSASLHAAKSQVARDPRVW